MVKGRKKKEEKKKKSPVFIPQNNPTLPLQKLFGVLFQILFLICFTVGSHKLINHLCDLCTQLQIHFFAFIL